MVGSCEELTGIKFIGRLLSGCSCDGLPLQVTALAPVAAVGSAQSLLISSC